MDSNMIYTYIIIALVLIVLPIVLGRLTGRNPMEIMFGERVNNTLFGRRKKKDSSGKEATGTEGGKEAGKDAFHAQKNSSRQDLMRTISALLSYARRNGFYCIVPGTLARGEEVASLAAVVVTRNSVLGFNCFGYGGTVTAVPGDGDWKQVLNGEETKIPSPVEKNRRQKEILDAVLKEAGYPEIRTEIFGVFTAADVKLKDHRGTRCYAQKGMMEALKGNQFLREGGINPKEVGKALEGYVKRAEKQQEKRDRRKQ